MTEISPANLAASIDSTLLKPEATADQIDRLCDEAMQFGFWGVCANLFWLPRLVRRFDSPNKQFKAMTVVSFPTGAIPTELKVIQARWAMDHGADEIDMIVNIGALRDGQEQLVQDDIAGSPGRTSKFFREDSKGHPGDSRFERG